MKYTVFFKCGIKLVNDGYTNKIIDESINAILDEFTGTVQDAVQYVCIEYGTKVK